MHWPTASIDWHLHSSGAGDGLSYNQTKAAIDAAYDSWQNVSTSTLTFSYQGSTDSTWGNDGLNVHYWADSTDNAWDSGNPFDDDPNASGITVVTINSSQEIIDADVLYNGEKVWYIGDYWTDIQSIATHEIGHTFGMHHSDKYRDDPTPVMSAAPGKANKSIQFDDREGISFLYGGNLIDTDERMSGTKYFNWDLTVVDTCKLTVFNSINRPNFYFQNGSSLTVEGTTVIESNSNIYFENGGKLIVNDSLKIDGTSSNTVLVDFYSPTSGNGIIVNSGGSVDIDYCTIRDGTFGLKLISAASAAIDNSTVTSGIYGVYVDNCEPTINDSEFSSNSYGMYIKNSYDSPSTTKHIDGNTIEDNSTYGIYLLNSSPTLADNLITDNDKGMAMFTGCDSYMEDNEIELSEHYGLAIYGSSSPVLFTRTGYPSGNNEIHDNTDEEVKITGTSDPTFGDWKYPGNNSIYDGDDYLMYNTTANTIDAEMNWWGSASGPDTSQLYGSIDYTPYKTSSSKTISNNDIRIMKRVSQTSSSKWDFAMEAFYNNSFEEAAERFENIIVGNSHISLQSKACNYLVKSLLQFLSIDKSTHRLSMIISNVKNNRIKGELLSLHSSYNERIGKYNEALNSLLLAEKSVESEELKNRIRLQKVFLQMNNDSDKSLGLQDLDNLMVSLKSNSYLHELALSIYDQEGHSIPKNNQSSIVNNNPLNYSLFYNYPNPFNPSTIITFQLPENGHVSLKVYDLLGREVVELVNSIKVPGKHEIKFDGSSLASGTYIYQIIVTALNEGGKGYSGSKKMLLVK